MDLTASSIKPSRPRRRVRSAAVALACAVAFTSSVAAAEAGEKKASIPSANLTQNPTFKHSAKGWDGLDAQVRRIRDRRAPDGRFAAKVKSGAGTDAYWMTGDPARLSGGSEAGAEYTGSAWVRGTKKTAGRTVQLVIRETDDSGDLVVDRVEEVKLTRRYRQIEVTVMARDNGNKIDMYLTRPEGETVSGDAFFADALTVTEKDLDGDDADPGDGNGDSPIPVTPPAGAAPSTVGQIAIINSQEDVLAAEQGSRYRYIVVRDGMHRYVDRLRQANPATDILLYKDLSFTIKDEPGCPFAPFEVTGVSFCDADSHENWFLHDASGNRLTSADYPDLYAMNLADPGYRAAWLSSVERRLLDANNDGSGVRWDGVYFDDTNLYPGHGINGAISEMSDGQYRQATVNFVATVSPALRAQGFVTMANVGMDMYDPAQRSAGVELAKYIDVYNREYFIRWFSDSGCCSVFTTPDANNGNDWIDELNFMESVQKTGASYSAVVYGTADEVEVQRYARATFLLGWNGKDGSALMYRAIGGGDAYLPGWTTDVGYPTSNRFEVGNGWQRNFQSGTVVMNPHPNQGQEFDLGSNYQLPGGECTSSVSLAPKRALVLPAC